VAGASTRMVRSTTARGSRPSRAVARQTRSSALGKPGCDRRQPSTGWGYRGPARTAWPARSRKGKCTTVENDKLRTGRSMQVANAVAQTDDADGQSWWPVGWPWRDAN
jgi:hypothetical protein